MAGEAKAMPGSCSWYSSACLLSTEGLEVRAGCHDAFGTGAKHTVAEENKKVLV
jgi:hypothetical protein